jgi:hypothetical protein
MYSVPVTVPAIRTRIRQEFEKHRFVNKLSVVDVLIFQSHADYQVIIFPRSSCSMTMERRVIARMGTTWLGDTVELPRREELGYS